MGKINSRAKGAQGERELAGYLREQGWQKARRTVQYAGNPEGGSGDVVCENFPFHIEGKRCQALKPEEWMAQAKRDCFDRRWWSERHNDQGARKCLGR